MKALSLVLALALITGCLGRPTGITTTVGRADGEIDRAGRSAHYDQATTYGEISLHIPILYGDSEQPGILVSREEYRAAALERDTLRAEVESLKVALAEPAPEEEEPELVAVPEPKEAEEVAAEEEEEDPEAETLDWPLILERVALFVLGGGALYGGQRGLPLAARAVRRKRE